MTSNVDHTAVPDSPLKRAEMAKAFHAQHSAMEEEMDSGQMRLEAMGYKQVGILKWTGSPHARRAHGKGAMSVAKTKVLNCVLN